MLITSICTRNDVGYRKLSDNAYLNTQTSEIKERKQNKSEYRSVESLRKSFFKLSLLINSNFFGDKSELFITLSYKNEVEADALNKDLKNFRNSLFRLCKSLFDFRCLLIIEPQRNGRPHIHALLKRLDGSEMTLSQSDVERIWKHGSCDIKHIYDINGLAEYLSPFKVKKKRKRLGFYKQNVRTYRCYGVFERAKKYTMSYGDAMALAKTKDFKVYKSCSYDVVNNENIIVNNISKIYFSNKLSDE